MKPPWRYRILIRALSPALCAYTLWRAIKDGGFRYWWQRLGMMYPDLAARETLWVHAASVGEVFTVLPLIKAWQAARRDAVVLLTTGTPTGAAIVQQQELAGVVHRYLPLDFPGACRRFIGQLHARHGVIVETEIWPWLYSECARQGISLTLVNGRLSPRTMQHTDGALGRMLGESFRQALSGVRILARSKQDAANFTTLGAPANQVQVVGNLKYAAVPESGNRDSPLQRNYVLAASTHDDEETRLAQRWAAQARRGELLVIVPRHPERGSAIERELTAHGIRVSRRSAGAQQADANDQVYLADTLGELQGWYQHAHAAFVGGSLIARGGHNMLEPARYACPTVVGPHTGNFDDIMHLMLDADAIHIARNVDEVIAFLLEAAHDSAAYRDMGKRAQAVSRDSDEVLSRYLTLLTAETCN